MSESTFLIMNSNNLFSLESKNAELINQVIGDALRSDNLKPLEFELLINKIQSMDRESLDNVHRRIISNGGVLKKQMKLCKHQILQLSRKLDIYASLNKSLSKSDMKLFNEFEDLIPYQVQRMRMRPDLQYEILKHKVIGQQESLKKLLANFYSIDRYWSSIEDQNPVQKPVTTQLLIGESGSGKSFIISEASKLLDATVIKIDGASLVAEGFVGPNLTEQIFHELRKIPEDNRTRILIHIDEFDKLSSKYNKLGSEAKGSGVCNELLKYLDYKTESVKGTASYEGRRNESIEIDVRNFCYVLSGAFTGLHNQEQQNSIGFTETINESGNPKISDIISYGIPKELAGRIGSINCLSPVTKELLYQILITDNPLITDLKNKFFELGETLNLSDEIHQIINLAYSKQIGVRGIASAIEELYSDRLTKLLGL